ncbi:hypothetical protein pb186bvf_015316, partial [Paramecium bursaria]
MVSCTQCHTDCLTCSGGGNQQCTSCAIGKLLNGSNGCQGCNSNCYVCSSTASNCQACLSGNYLQGTNCNSCSGSCATCQSQQGQYWDGSLCKSCTATCISCSSTLYCMTCMTGYTSNNGICQCNQGKFGPSCTACPVNCASCTSLTDCQSCNGSNKDVNSACSCTSGYYDAGSTQCSQCATYCDSCTSLTNCTNCNALNLINGICTCPSGQFPSGTSCLSCQNQCQTCSSAVFCLSCVDATRTANGTGICVCASNYVDVAGTCTACVSPCATCITTVNTCQSCVSNDMTLSSNTCQCPSGEYQSGNTCATCTAPCSNCSGTSTYCLSCTGSYRTLTSNQCPCDYGYFDFSGTCTQCSQYCTICTSSANCTNCQYLTLIGGICTCQSNQYQSGTTCINCISPCSQCTSSTYCTACIATDRTADGQGNCVCAARYYDNLGTCTSCYPSCATCNNATTCQSCLDVLMDLTSVPPCLCPYQHYQQGNSCSHCSLPCSECTGSATFCTSCSGANRILNNNSCPCNTGYYDDGTNCNLCQSPCLNCTSLTFCTSCLVGNMIIQSGICQCQQGLTLISNSCQQCQLPCTQCVGQINYCSQCVDPQSIIVSGICQCNTSYYMDLNYICQSCSSNCHECLNSYNNCTSCNGSHVQLIQNTCVCDSGYSFINNLCQQCIGPCAQCINSVNYCTQCIDPLQAIVNGNCLCLENQIMDNNYICQNCQLPCKQCMNSVNYCITCNDSQMTISSQGQCLCNIGYYEDQNHICQVCILGCLICNNNSDCVLCEQSYILTIQFQCEYCQPPCKQCEGQATYCTTCVSFLMEIVNNQCQCLSNYYFQNNECYNCGIDLCNKCTSQKICLECQSIPYLILIDNQCQCKDGYYFNGTYCQVCDKNCLTCQSYPDQCITCEIQQNRALSSDFKCQCIQNYFEETLSNFQTVCQQCDQNNGKDNIACKFFDLFDGIWTYGEQCDDGNRITRDGCSNGKIDFGFSCTNIILQPSTCYKCPDNCVDCDQNLICTQCRPQYLLSVDLCLECSDLCQECSGTVNNCLKCKYLKKNETCITCEQQKGFYTNLQDSSCYSICGDDILAISEQCDDGNLLDGDGCSQQCKLEQGFLLLNGTIMNIVYPIPTLSETYQQIYDPIRNLTLHYDQPLILQYINLKSDIQIIMNDLLVGKDYVIDFYDNSIYKQEQQIIQSFNITIQLNFYKSIDDTELTLKFKNRKLFKTIKNVAQNVEILTVKVSKYQLIEQQTVATTQGAVQSNLYLLYLLLGMLFFSILFGGIDVFYNLLDLLQILSYLQYVNTEFPYNLQQFLNLFQFAQIQFLSQYIQFSYYYSSEIDDSQITIAPQKIYDDGYSTSMIINISIILTLWAGLIFSYILSYILPCLLNQIQYDLNKSTTKCLTYFKIILITVQHQIIQVCWLMRRSFFYSGFYRTFISSANDYCFLLVLNIYILSFDDKYVVNNIASYLTIVLLLLYFLILYFGLSIIKQDPCQLKQQDFSYGALYEGLHLTIISKYYNIYLLVKKLLFMEILILSYYQPFLQITLTTVLSLLQIIYLFVFEPFTDALETRKQLYSEIYIFFIQGSITILVIDDYLLLLNYNGRINVGYF